MYRYIGDSPDASSVENKWLGESEKNAKAVFTLARRLAPCVVFIDEVDSLLSSREGSSDDSAHGTLTSVKTVSTFLSYNVCCLTFAYSSNIVISFTASLLFSLYLSDYDE